MYIPLLAAALFVGADVPSGKPYSEPELQMLSDLISVTEDNLVKEKTLLKEVEAYLQLQKLYMENTQDKKLSLQMVRKAKEVLVLIKNLSLEYSFNQKFLSELTFFSQIADKWE